MEYEELVRNREEVQLDFFNADLFNQRMDRRPDDREGSPRPSPQPQRFGLSDALEIVQLMRRRAEASSAVDPAQGRTRLEPTHDSEQLFRFYGERGSISRDPEKELQFMDRVRQSLGRFRQFFGETHAVESQAEGLAPEKRRIASQMARDFVDMLGSNTSTLDLGKNIQLPPKPRDDSGRSS